MSTIEHSPYFLTAKSAKDASLAQILTMELQNLEIKFCEEGQELCNDVKDDPNKTKPMSCAQNDLPKKVPTESKMWVRKLLEKCVLARHGEVLKDVSEKRSKRVKAPKGHLETKRLGGGGTQTAGRVQKKTSSKLEEVKNESSSKLEEVKGESKVGELKTPKGLSLRLKARMWYGDCLSQSFDRKFLRKPIELKVSGWVSGRKAKIGPSQKALGKRPDRPETDACARQAVKAIHKRNTRVRTETPDHEMWHQESKTIKYLRGLES
ncbi:hypothetical protein BYT27DRAFT_7208437 [Phlegmacium glaucopus]|nr:hypothetical protein BYT27DRAFT_7208437 [Phlegmacium glaucopus]